MIASDYNVIHIEKQVNNTIWMNKDKQVVVCTGSMKTQVKKLRCEAIKPSSRSLFEEKVYDVSGIHLNI